MYAFLRIATDDATFVIINNGYAKMPTPVQIELNKSAIPQRVVRMIAEGAESLEDRAIIESAGWKSGSWGRWQDNRYFLSPVPMKVRGTPWMSNSRSNPLSEHVIGLPEHLPAGTVATLFHYGAAIAIAIGERLTTYTLDVNCGRVTARQDGEYPLPGHALVIVESTLGLVICVDRGQASELLLFRDCELVPVMSLPARVTTLTAGGSDLFMQCSCIPRARRPIGAHQSSTTHGCCRPAA